MWPCRWHPRAGSGSGPSPPLQVVPVGVQGQSLSLSLCLSVSVSKSLSLSLCLTLSPSLSSSLPPGAAWRRRPPSRDPSRLPRVPQAPVGSPFSFLLPSHRGPSPSPHPTETHHPGFRVSRCPRVSVFLLPSPFFFHPGTKPESVARAARVSLSHCPPVLVLPSSCFLLPSHRGPSPSLHPTETHHPGFRVSRRPPVSVCLLPSSTQGPSLSPCSSGLCRLSVPPSPYLLCLMGTNLGPEPQPGFPTSCVALSLGSPRRRRLRSASSAPVVPVEV